MDCILATHPGPNVAPLFGALLIMVCIIVFLAVVAIKALICCRIFAKTGYCWAFGLLMLVPIADVIMAFVLAFGDWPVQKELRLLKQQRP